MMSPGLERGDLVLSSPFLSGVSTPLGKLPPLIRYARGDLVVVPPEISHPERMLLRVWDSLVRFFSLQHISPIATSEGRGTTTPGLYRILGLPGDCLRMNGSGYEIKVAGKDSYLPEGLVVEREYSISGSPGSTVAPADTSAAAELATKEIILGKGEYFAACDDRSAFEGSSLWGPLDGDRIAGRLVLAFWPLRRLKFL